jgi:hypothetical protein
VCSLSQVRFPRELVDLLVYKTEPGGWRPSAAKKCAKLEAQAPAEYYVG